MKEKNKHIIREKIQLSICANPRSPLKRNPAHEHTLNAIKTRYLYLKNKNKKISPFKYKLNL